jgi:hypothetical protein
MAAGVNLLKLFDADFGVNGGGVELGVAEQLLDESDVGPVFEHVRRAGVPQQVARGHAARHLFDPTGQLTTPIRPEAGASAKIRPYDASVGIPSESGFYDGSVVSRSNGIFTMPVR